EETMLTNEARVDTIRVWLDAALQQVAAESYWHLLQAGLTPNQILQRGNSPSNPANPTQPADQFIRLTEKQALIFLDRYEIIDHHPNDWTGFSATLLKDTETGQYTLAFRSLEYKNRAEGGDLERDGKLGAAGEINEKGFAFAQL